MSAKPLGRGLDALLGGGAKAPLAPAFAAAPEGTPLRVMIDLIDPCRFQPRKDFRQDLLEELAASIREKGILQPLIARKLPTGRYELIAGERRFRASKMAGLADVPIVLRDASDEEVLEWALIENLQRADLNAIEEAEGYLQLQKQFNLTQEQIAKAVGKSRPAVANALRLLELEPQVRAFVANGQISVGHAKVLLGVREAPLQRELAEEVIRRALNVRGTEELVASATRPAGAATSAGSQGGGLAKRPGASATGGSGGGDSHLRDLQEKLRQTLGTQVAIHHSTTSGKGRIEIEYYNLDDLSRLLDALGVSTE